MNTSPTLHTAALAALEQVLNRALELDPNSHRVLAPLSGSVFALHCSAPPFQVFLLPEDKGIRLAGQHVGTVTTRVSGEASDFAELATAADPTAALINGKLSLEGDSGPLIELQKALSGLDLDWEAPLVNQLGDVIGHQVAQSFRGLFSFSKQAHSSLERQLEEFIHEEARLCPPRLELEDFYRDVAELAERSERLASRTERLRARIRRLKS
ncbi:SCP2 sterol-binding domain-containing protein [Parahaliea sp. F7430]|uniref:Ubiquinone biosynthesis accessory factor UbiJ n=1 Tax=Sediminihaliea albiluteola TaxID=2758564 RepID=A0A7W2TXT9_9GAMM|nr:SCP2 sterol-binding domain-containing protein [Sediminihaliea albiluteola]MBA6413933.1 SCP2 sterol-binding domain-containing protein [Sediminihaliea albiluteola]